MDLHKNLAIFHLYMLDNSDISEWGTLSAETGYICVGGVHVGEGSRNRNQISSSMIVTLSTFYGHRLGFGRFALLAVSEDSRV